LVLALYLPGLLLALLSALPALLGLRALAQLGPWDARLAEGDFASLAVEVVGSVLVRRTLPSDGFEPALATAGLAGLTAVLVVLIGLVLHGLCYSFLVGGVLARLAGGAHSPFWAACRRWFWPMLRFGLLAMLFGFLSSGLLLLALALLPGSDPAAWSFRLLALAGWLACLNGLFELARADLVLRGDPRASRALGRALALPFRRPRRFLLALLLWIALALLSALYAGLHGGTLLLVPATAVAASVLLQQLLALLAAWLKLLRLAVAVELAR
jgi:hypothetical protein